MQKKRYAVIVGASSGLGRAFCQVLDQQEDFTDFVLIARRSDLLEELMETLIHPCYILSGDVGDTEFMQRVENFFQEEQASIQHLVVSAGFGKSASVEELGNINAEMVRINALALTQMNTICLSYMESGSYIYNVASVAAFMPQHGFATYAATKSYVLSYSRALNSELKSRGIHVLAVCPNPMETDFFRDSTGAGVQGIKRLAIEKPEQVARKALAKAQKNKDVSLTNFSAYFLLILSRILPHRLVLWFERKFS